MKTIVALVTLISTLAHCSTIDFCDKTICGDKTHICCGIRDKFLSHCPKGIQMFKITPTAAELMVDEHNKIREFYASGSHDQFEKAARIPELVRFSRGRVA
jgi:hypothetical protein